MESLTPEQQSWAANLAISAIWADGEITLPEFERFSKLMQLMSDRNETRVLVKKLESKELEPIELVKGLDQDALAQIYMEMLGIMICDWDLAEGEKDYLDKLASTFGFTKMYHNKLIHWAEEGLSWQEEQRYLLPKGMDITDARIPLHDMDAAQKVWYAEALVSAIMIDGIIDNDQMHLLRRALNFIESPKETQRLVGYVKNKLRPSLLSPPGLEQDVIYKIFFEILRVMSSNDLSNKELVFIGDYARVCNMPAGVEDLSIEWIKKGVSWRHKKKNMTAGHAFEGAEVSSLGKSEDRWLDHSGNNSLTYREEGCWHCDEDFDVVVYRLRPKSQKPYTNLFGFPYFKDSATKKDDFLDFNRIKISICPNCLLASPNKDLYKPKTATVRPKVFSMRPFENFWREGLAGRKTAFGQLLEKRDPLRPDLLQIKSMYRLAMQSAEAIKQFDPVGANQWASISLNMTLAEILREEGLESEAEKYLFEAEKLAQEMQTSTRENTYSLMSARLLFMIALYKGDKMAAGGLLNFFLKLKDEKFDSMTQEEKGMFTGILNGVKRDFDDRAELVKKKLKGFHRRVYVAGATDETEEA